MQLFSISQISPMAALKEICQCMNFQWLVHLMVHLLFKELAENNSIFVSGIESNRCRILIIIHFILVSSL